MHLLFFVGLGELFVRARTGAWENAQIHAHSLPEDEAMCCASRIWARYAARSPIISTVRTDFCRRLSTLAILQLQSTRSIDQAVSVLRTSLGINESKVEQRYAMVRYLAWVIPTMGFIGTVSHLGNALRLVDPNHMNIFCRYISTGNCVQYDAHRADRSAILVLIQNVVQTREDAAVDNAAEYCLRNLINRLYIT